MSDHDPYSDFSLIQPGPARAAKLTQSLHRGSGLDPFSHPDWLFDVKWDGFRCLAYIEHGRCRLVSRNGNEFKSFPALNGASRRSVEPNAQCSMAR